MNFITEHGLDSYEALESKLASLTERRDTAHASIKEIEQRMSDLNLTMKHAATYRQLKPVYDRYRKSRDKEKFLRGHESEIILFEAAARELKRMGAVPVPAAESMKIELAELAGKKDVLLTEYRATRSEVQEYETIKKNMDMLLDTAPEQEQKRSYQLE